ncbi:unnamed protein product [Moneuplotes crassus]|uniref:Uncharacterized protein n=1 Tax=Euplotes crassus TaxID=5936 RepID=A0AAD1U953_EUPCR|nr:unnamed protein product [Moneuplotes crassus]
MSHKNSYISLKDIREKHRKKDLIDAMISKKEKLNKEKKYAKMLTPTIRNSRVLNNLGSAFKITRVKSKKPSHWDSQQIRPSLFPKTGEQAIEGFKVTRNHLKCLDPCDRRYNIDVNLPTQSQEFGYQLARSKPILSKNDFSSSTENIRNIGLQASTQDLLLNGENNEYTYIEQERKGRTVVFKNLSI